jgi:hypothetical protein
MCAVAIIWIVIILVLMPFQAFWSRRKVKKLRPTRFQAYASNMAGLIFAGVITFAVDWLSGRTGVQAAKFVSTWSVVSAWPAQLCSLALQFGSQGCCSASCGISNRTMY